MTIDLEDYRNPADLPAGAVLVVGSGQSGCQITEELYLKQTGGERGRACRPVGPLVGAGAEDYRPGHDLSGRGLQEETAVAPRPQRGYLDAFPHRRFEPCRVALEVRHDLIAGHKAVGVVAVVGMAGELEEPVRSDQTEAVPAPPPALPDPAPLEHAVGDARVRELAADREPGLTGTDNDNLDPIGHPGVDSMRVSGAE